jgi:uncharacterized protein YjbI with pentapeptide repeats
LTDDNIPDLIATFTERQTPGFFQESIWWVTLLTERRIEHGCAATCQQIQCGRARVQQRLLGQGQAEWGALSEANLSEANLNGANLSGANLKRACLDKANLNEADLRGANLEGTFLYGAYLAGANLEGAKLHGADLSGAIMPDGTIYE